MRKIRLTLNVLTASVLLAACAQTPTKEALNIQPLQEVRHSYEQATAQYALGRYYHGQLRYERAIEAYRRVLAIDPGMVDAMNAMGSAYAESGNLALAREQFEAALKLQPESVYTLNNLGYVNYLAGDYPAAVQAYKQALRLDGRHEKARHNLLLVMERMGAGDRIALTRQDPIVAPKQSEESGVQGIPQGSWVRVSPVIYEMRSALASAANTPATLESASVANRGTAEPTASQPVTPSPAPLQLAAAARTPEKQRAAMMSVEAAPNAAATAQKLNATLLASPIRGVEVSNGNGIRGLAAVVARYFSSRGVQHARLTNQKPFGESRTRIEYRPGNSAEAARINAFLPKAAPQVVSTRLRPGVRVRLVLGNDLGHDVAAWGDPSESSLVAASLTGGVDSPQL